MLRKLLVFLLSCLVLFTMVLLLRPDQPSRRERIADSEVPEVLEVKIGNSGDIKGKTLRCILGLYSYKCPSMTFPAGYEYELLRQFCSDNGATAKIVPSKGSQAYSFMIPDSTYLLVLPSAEKLPEGFRATKPLSDGTVWVTREKDFLLLEKAEAWLSEFTSSSAGSALRARFTPSYGPYHRTISGKAYPSASPYDDILKKYAPTIGWDWRALAALVWRESGFHIEAVSYAGAQGLMQMMPGTFRMYSKTDDTLDPDNNIMVGVKYIGVLEDIMRKYTSDPDELRRFALACYNLGNGKFQDVLDYAKRHNLPCSTWTQVLAILPNLSPEALEAKPDPDVKFGPIKGDDLIDYINEMESLYRAFVLIAP